MYKICIGDTVVSKDLSFEPAAALFLSFAKLPGLCSSVNLVKEDIVIETFSPSENGKKKN